MIADAGNPIRADQSAARRDCAGGGKPGDARDLRLRMAAAHNICGHERKAECAWPALRDRSNHGLLARAPVDAFAQQIGVAHVAGILLNKVDDDVARLHLLAVDVDGRVKV